jgi:GAF domain-containing protein
VTGTPTTTTLASALDAIAAVRLDDGAVEAVLQLVVSLSKATVDGVDGASISVLRTQGMETSNATSDEVRDIDGHQYATGEGPCVTAIQDGRRHNVVLSAETARWPRFVAAATAAGVGSMLSIPLTSEGRAMGALNLYSRDERFLPDASVADAQALADRAAVVLANAITFATTEATNRHLQTALENARLIGRAQGVLMAREGCGSEKAFNILRRASQRTNRKLREIAEEIVAPFEPPSTREP